MCLAQGPQCSDAGEARTRGPSVWSQAHCAPICVKEVAASNACIPPDAARCVLENDCLPKHCFVVFLVFAIILMRKRDLVLYFVCLPDVLILFVALPHGALGWSVVCDCGIS